MVPVLRNREWKLNFRFLLGLESFEPSLGFRLLGEIVFNRPSTPSFPPFTADERDREGDNFSAILSTQLISPASGISKVRNISPINISLLSPYQLLPPNFLKFSWNLKLENCIWASAAAHRKLYNDKLLLWTAVKGVPSSLSRKFTRLDWWDVQVWGEDERESYFHSEMHSNSNQVLWCRGVIWQSVTCRRSSTCRGSWHLFPKGWLVMPGH